MILFLVWIHAIISFRPNNRQFSVSRLILFEQHKAIGQKWKTKKTSFISDTMLIFDTFQAMGQWNAKTVPPQSIEFLTQFDGLIPTISIVDIALYRCTASKGSPREFSPQELTLCQDEHQPRGTNHRMFSSVCHHQFGSIQTTNSIKTFSIMKSPSESTAQWIVEIITLWRHRTHYYTFDGQLVDRLNKHAETSPSRLSSMSIGHFFIQRFSLRCSGLCSPL